MLINKENFQSTLPLIEEYIRESDFASFDIEMTGISNELKNDGTTYDSHQYRYSKCKEIVKQFEIIQFGLTLYKSKEIKKEDSNSISYLKDHSQIYLERTFNFQLLKNSKFSFINNKNEEENSLFSSVSNFHPASLKFMNHSNFDFENLYKNGIHYNKLLKRDLIERTLDENVISCNKKFRPVLYLSEKNEMILMQEIYEITKFLCADPDLNDDNTWGIENNSNNNNNQKNNNNNKLNNNIKKLELVRENMPLSVVNYILNLNFKKLLRISGFNILLRESGNEASIKTGSIIVKKSRSKLNDNQFKEEHDSLQNFKNKLNMDFIQNLRYNLTNKNTNNEDANNFNKAEAAASAAALENSVNEELGFAKIIEILIKQKKKLIGHNIYFDILFLYDKLIDDLPETFYEFKSNFNQLFPVVYDTKYIATTYAKDFDLTKLESIYQRIQKEKYNLYTIIKQDIYNGFAFYSEIDTGGSLLHDAGYDSILTGRCFIYMMKAIENNFCLENRKESNNRIQNILIMQTKEVIVKKGLVNFDFSLSKMNLFCEEEEKFNKVKNTNIEKDANLVFDENNAKMHLKDFANKTILGLLENPFHIVCLDETKEEFDIREKASIEDFYRNVFYFEFKDEFMTIYEMTNNINSENVENEYFNLRVVKNTVNGALVEFRFGRNGLVQDPQLLLDQLIEKLRNKSNIKSIISLKEFMGKF